MAVLEDYACSASLKLNNQIQQVFRVFVLNRHFPARKFLKSGNLPYRFASPSMM
jgi:hypothetical protein